MEIKNKKILKIKNNFYSEIIKNYYYFFKLFFSENNFFYS